MTNLDIKRLADVALDTPQKTSLFVERQFPAIYRTDGRELVELVKAYYRFLEGETNQSIYNIRKIHSYRDIDKTLESMLIFFKNKFLDGIFFDDDTRFVIKHILDLYRRKGSKEGIELFFRLFFEDEVDIYYPSFDMFKPSQSSWKEGRYIQLNAITEISKFNDITNRKIYGSISAAEAYVDNVFFINIRSSIIPIVFISGVKGQFQDFDAVFSTEPSFVEYGSVYGSLNNVNVEQNDIGQFTSNNRVGDRVEILSENSGVGAKGRISEVSQNFSGEIIFTIDDGGFGYTSSSYESGNTESNVFISEQLIFLNNQNRDFAVEEIIRQTNSAGIDVYGFIVGQKVDSVGVILDRSFPNSESTDYLFESGYPIQTIFRDSNITKDVLFVTEFNDSSSFEVDQLSNLETVTIVTDIIEDFAAVSLGSGNFNDSSLTPFSGASVVNITTPLNVAFAPREFEVGTISSLKNINPGSDYQGDVFVLVKENLFARFNLRNQVIAVVPANVNFFIGDTVTQQRNITTFEGEAITVTVRGRVIAVNGNNITVKSLTFNQFISKKIEFIEGTPTIVSVPIFKEGIAIPVTINAISKDFIRLPASLNAEIRGDVSLAVGKIKSIDVTDAGFGYTKNERINILNLDKRERIITQLEASSSNTEIQLLESLLQNIDESGDAFGVSDVKNQGRTEGRWVTFESHTNQEKVIQDSIFYQDYSYEISTSVPETVFSDTYINVVHPAGLKFFTKFSKTDVINTYNSVTHSLDDDFDSTVDAATYLETANNGFIYLISEDQ